MRRHAELDRQSDSLAGDGRQRRRLWQRNLEPGRGRQRWRERRRRRGGWSRHHRGFWWRDRCGRDGGGRQLRPRHRLLQRRRRVHRRREVCRRKRLLFHRGAHRCVQDALRGVRNLLAEQRLPESGDLFRCSGLSVHGKLLGGRPAREMRQPAVSFAPASFRGLE